MATIQSTQEPTQQKSVGSQNTLSHHDIIDYHPQASIIDNQPQFSAGGLKHSMHGQIRSDLSIPDAVTHCHIEFYVVPDSENKTKPYCTSHSPVEMYGILTV